MPTYLNHELAAYLPPLRLVSRTAQEYAGACPFCGGDQRQSDRFHLWLLPAGRERYWCRRCDRKGSLAELRGRAREQPGSAQRTSTRQPDDGPIPCAAHIPHYRALYATVAAWASSQLHQPWNPDPLAYLQRRGFSSATIRAAQLGYALGDPESLLAHLRRSAATLLPYAEAAGVLARDDQGALRIHWNLCGRIVIPYQSNGVTYDLRMRRLPGHGYLSLHGGYLLRGATIPYCWDVTSATDVVIITEGELKALAVTAAYYARTVPHPAIAHPGLSYFRSEWAITLAQRGVRVAILAYDARATRPRDPTGNEQLAAEERWTIQHGRTLAAAGIQVLVLQLPLSNGAEKEDLDHFLLCHGPRALSDLLRRTPIPLHSYIDRLPRELLLAAAFGPSAR